MSDEEKKAELTLGEKRVRTEFNPSNTGNVNAIKEKTAELINILDDFKNDPRSNIQGNPEALRLVSVAMTEFESAAMWAVKAVTS